MAKQKKDEYQPTEEDIARMTRLANCLLDMVIEDQKLPPEERKFHILDDGKNSPINCDGAILLIIPNLLLFPPRTHLNQH